jgi:hypothetical protein
MDAVVILIIALLISLKVPTSGKEVDMPDQIIEEVIKREVMLNPDFYEDQNAFMKVANNLGFY